MNLFIIGNGFDLGHDLSTKYWDFRCFLEEYRGEFLKDFEDKYSLWGEELKTFLWNNFEYNLANLNEEIIVEEMYQSTDLGLESGNVGIEDTLDYYFEKDFKYIEKLTIYLKEWIEVVNKDLDNLNRRTSLIDENNQDTFINFNYTTTLEKVYNISEQNVLHIHGVINTDDDLVLGHSNLPQFDKFLEKREIAKNKADEQSAPIYNILADYCYKTYKNVEEYTYKLFSIDFELVSQITIVGHSLGEVDLPYFRVISERTKSDVEWQIYYYSEKEINSFKEKLVRIGIDEQKIIFTQSDSFYNQPILEQT